MRTASPLPSAAPRRRAVPVAADAYPPPRGRFGKRFGTRRETGFDLMRDDAAGGVQRDTPLLAFSQFAFSRFASGRFALSRRRPPARMRPAALLALALLAGTAAGAPAYAASDLNSAPVLSNQPQVMPLPRPDAAPPAPLPELNGTVVPAVPYAQPATPATGTPKGNEVPLYLVAKLTASGKPLSTGVVWRIFSIQPDAAGKLPLVAVSAGGDGEFRLRPGTYMVHAAYGQAGETRKVEISHRVVTETVVLHAGGLQLDAVIDDKTPLPAEEVTFDISRGDEDAASERASVVSGVKPGAIVRLPAGTYHVTSHYGGVNAVMRADIEVEAGKLVRATLHHKAAEVTLKLVASPGGEALANTQWTVRDADGKVLAEKVGAFPSMVLAAGKYDIVARNGDKTWTESFSVEPGRNRDLEIVAKGL